MARTAENGARQHRFQSRQGRHLCRIPDERDLQEDFAAKEGSAASRNRKELNHKERKDRKGKTT
jgi:hypothetical protein